MRVKICCVHTEDEVRLAAMSGADALGFVVDMPSGPGVIDLARAATLIPHVPPLVTSVLLTRRQDAATLLREAATVGASTLQLVLPLAPATAAELRAARPDLRLIQVVHVTGEAALAAAARAGAYADALLLDSGNPEGQGGAVELGGTGRTHDWQISRTIRERAPCPVILAGGLNAANLARAIATVRPYAVDVCSGVRAPDGRLDPDKLSAFMRAARAEALPVA